MSPEQVRHLSADPRSDVFSFGVVLFELLSAARPFAGGSAAEAMASILRDDPAPLRARSDAVPAGQERLVSRCLAVESKDAPTGYRLDLAPFRGWQDEPVW